MNITHVKKERNEGKTTMAVNIFFLNPENTEFICFSRRQVDYVLRKFPQMIPYRSRISVIDSLKKRGRRFSENYIFDDFEYMDKKTNYSMDIIGYLFTVGVKNIFTFSSYPEIKIPEMKITNFNW